VAQEISTSTFPLEKPVESTMGINNRSDEDFWVRYFLHASLGHCPIVTGVSMSVHNLHKRVKEPN